MGKRFATSQLDYDLPQELIAQAPSEERGDSRLMVVDRAASSVVDCAFKQLAEHVHTGDVLVLNNTRVLPAKFALWRDTGGRIEGLFLCETHPGCWEVMLKGAGRLRMGEVLHFTGNPTGAPEVKRDVGDWSEKTNVVAIDNLGRGRWLLGIESELATVQLLDRFGRMPLPPYIKRESAADERDTMDRERYQTVYAARDRAGAVAAPTAGLHFTDEHLAALDQMGVAAERITLHVGYGTFAPLEVDNLADHHMHEESFEIEGAVAHRLRATRMKGGRVIAVGTTSARVLETAWARNEWRSALAGSTNLFCYPPYQFAGVDLLLTNFHLPRSTLLALVMAFAGVELTRSAYAHAIEQRYRFFSYGDAMLIV